VDFEMAKRVLAALEEHGVRYAVFGGVALNFHGIARFTEDMDLFVAPERKNLEAMKEALRSVFADPDIDEISVDEMLGSYPAIQYVPPSGDFHIDLLTRLGQAFAFDDLEVQKLPFDDVLASVVTPRTLYRMKRDTVRLKDRADAEMLRQKFGDELD